eukprot:2871322-Rhodomonas_salina.1
MPNKTKLASSSRRSDLTPAAQVSAQTLHSKPSRSDLAVSRSNSDRNPPNPVQSRAGGSREALHLTKSEQESQTNEEKEKKEKLKREKVGEGTQRRSHQRRRKCVCERVSD